MAGLLLKPLTAARIVEHMEKVGLESEFVLHHRMAGLSGGKKIKVVLGAALWQNPHILVMDEPSNYLDRDSLGALAAAIKEFGGGVLLVTHHSDFTAELCSETWTVADAVLSTTGTVWAADKLEKKDEPDEVVDGAGNVIKIAKKLTGKELRKKNKERALRRKRGEEDVSSDEEEPAT
jgi:elongation factor 3